MPVSKKIHKKSKSQKRRYQKAVKAKTAHRARVQSCDPYTIEVPAATMRSDFSYLGETRPARRIDRAHEVPMQHTLPAQRWVSNAPRAYSAVTPLLPVEEKSRLYVAPNKPFASFDPHVSHKTPPGTRTKMLKIIYDHKANFNKQRQRLFILKVILFTCFLSFLFFATEAALDWFHQPAPIRTTSATIGLENWWNNVTKKPNRKFLKHIKTKKQRQESLRRLQEKRRRASILAQKTKATKAKAAAAAKKKRRTKKITNTKKKAKTSKRVHGKKKTRVSTKKRQANRIQATTENKRIQALAEGKRSATRAAKKQRTFKKKKKLKNKTLYQLRMERAKKRAQQRKIYRQRSNQYKKNRQNNRGKLPNGA